jgi:hypothetical protein
MRPPPPADGTVVAFTGKTLTVKDAHGVATTYAVADDARILQLRKIDASAIKPGSFVATANSPTCRPEHQINPGEPRAALETNPTLLAYRSAASPADAEVSAARAAERPDWGWEVANQR